jgi:hypothetical protein
MSIAEQIMLGTQQQSNNFSALSNSLSQLGQQVGQSLAMREYQKQYQAALPVIENAMRSATQKIQAGDYTGGYAEAVSGLPLMSQNPLIAQASKSYLDSIKNVAEFQQNQMWNDLQRSRMVGPTTRTTLPGMRVPTAQELADPNYTPDTTVVDTTVTDVTNGGDMEARFVGTDMTQGTPAQRQMQAQADQEYRTYEQADRAAAAALPVDGGGAEAFISSSELTVPSTPPKKEDIKAVAEFRAKNPEQQDAQQREITVAENQVPKDSTVVSFGDIPGIPFGGIAGKNKATVEATEKFTPKGRESQRTTKQIGDFDAFTNNATVIGARISNNKTLMDLFAAANGNWNNVQTAQETDEEGRPIGVAYVNGKRFETPLTTVQVQKDTIPEAFGEVQMIEFVKGIVPIAGKNGWKLIGQEAPAEAPAPAAGGGSVAERVRAQYGKKEGAAQPTAAQPAPAAQAPEATLEERIASKTKSVAMPARTATPQQQATLERTRQSQTKSNLQSEKTRLERIIYETPRGGQRKLKPGLTKQDADVKEVLAKITEINKQLEGL